MWVQHQLKQKIRVKHFDKGSTNIFLGILLPLDDLNKTKNNATDDLNILVLSKILTTFWS